MFYDCNVQQFYLGSDDGLSSGRSERLPENGLIIGEVKQSQARLSCAHFPCDILSGKAHVI